MLFVQEPTGILQECVSRLLHESQPDWAFESEEWKQPLYSGA